MCLHFMRLTQVYPHCAFETPNLENYFHLSMFMLLRAGKSSSFKAYSCSSEQCSHLLLLTHFYLHCAFEPPNLAYYLHLKHIYIPQGNVFTYGVSDAILFSLRIWNPQYGKLFSFKAYPCSSEQCVHIWCFWRKFILIAPFRSQFSEKGGPFVFVATNQRLFILRHT